MNVNIVALSGNLTKDPEWKDVGNGLARLRLAVNKRTKIDGEWGNTPMYFDVDCWGKLGELCRLYLHRGNRVMVSGRLDWREWDSESGKRSAIAIVADTVEFPTKRESQQAQESAPSSERTSTPESAPEKLTPQPPQDPAGSFDDDDIPF